MKNGPIALGKLTALMLAAPAGGPEVVKALLDAGAKVNAEDVRQMTPLMLAVATDRADPRTVRLLLRARRRCRPERSRTDMTAADWAKKNNAPAILRELGLHPRRKRRMPARDHPRLRCSASWIRIPPPRAPSTVLQQGSGSFFKEGGCGACHAQNLTSMAVNAAYANHIPVNAEAKAAEIKGAQLAFAGFVQPLLQRGDPPVVDILLYAGMQMASENVAADQTTDAMVHNMVAQQRAAGNWHMAWVERPPMEDGDFSRTAMGIRLLQLYGARGTQGGTAEAHRARRRTGWPPRSPRPPKISTCSCSA